MKTKHEVLEWIKSILDKNDEYNAMVEKMRSEVDTMAYIGDTLVEAFTGFGTFEASSTEIHICKGIEVIADILGVELVISQRNSNVYPAEARLNYGNVELYQVFPYSCARVQREIGGRICS